MRNIKSIALISALVFSNVAFAVTSPSAPLTNDTASVATTDDVGTFGSQVSFDVSTGTVTLDGESAGEFLQPGKTYTISIPVTNHTDRAITVSLSNVSLGGDGATFATKDEGASVTIAANDDDFLTITVTIKSDAADMSSKEITVNYTVTGVAEY